MQIKTVVYRLTEATQFDRAVNELLRDGWKLERRYVVRGSRLANDKYHLNVLVAELIKE